MTGIRPLARADIQYNARPPLTRDGKVVMTGRAVMAGGPDTYVTYLRPWANVSNTPFRLYKHWVHEGGIATPLIVHWPAGIKDRGALRTQICHEIDIMPTIVELAGAQYPSTYGGHAITPEAGLSLVPTFRDDPLPPRTLFWEHEMNRAVRMGAWKLVSVGGLVDKVDRKWRHYQIHPWELYNMDKDRTELHDLSKQNPDVVHKMAAMWDKWAHQVGVFPAPWTPEN
jgi:arylsulfatase